MLNEKIRFRDLNGWLKAAVILAWCIGGYLIFWFFVGMVIGAMELI